MAELLVPLMTSWRRSPLALGQPWPAVTPYGRPGHPDVPRSGRTDSKADVLSEAVPPTAGPVRDVIGPGHPDGILKVHGTLSWEPLNVPRSSGRSALAGGSQDGRIAGRPGHLHFRIRWPWRRRWPGKHRAGNPPPDRLDVLIAAHLGRLPVTLPPLPAPVVWSRPRVCAGRLVTA